METTEYVQAVQQQLGLSDTKLAASLGVTRQTVANWRKGRCCPTFVVVALRGLMELRRLDPANDNLPAHLRVRL